MKQFAIYLFSLSFFTGCLPGKVPLDTSNGALTMQVLLMGSFRFQLPACGGYTPALYLTSGLAKQFQFLSSAPTHTGYQNFGSYFYGCQPASVSDGTTTVTFKYSSAGLLTQYTPGSSQPTSISYNADGYPLRVIAPCANGGLTTTTTFTLNSFNYVTSIEGLTPANCTAPGNPAQDATALYQFTYSTSPLPDRFTSTNGAVVLSASYTRTFDASGRLIRLDSNCVTQTPSCLSNFQDSQTYTYLADGKLAGTTSTNVGKTQNFTYDANNNLKTIVSDPAGANQTDTFNFSGGRINSVVAQTTSATYTFN